MKTASLNLFILDENKSSAEELKKYLSDHFGDGISVLTFNDRDSCLDKIDKDTHIVVLSDMVNGQNGIDILKAIKKINYKTEVIMLSDRENLPSKIESYRAGVKGWVKKEPGSETKIATIISSIFMFPIKVIEKELGIPQRLAMFMLSFITVVIIVVLYYYFFIKKV